MSSIFDYTYYQFYFPKILRKKTFPIRFNNEHFIISDIIIEKCSTIYNGTLVSFVCLISSPIIFLHRLCPLKNILVVCVNPSKIFQEVLIYLLFSAISELPQFILGITNQRIKKFYDYVDVQKKFLFFSQGQLNNQKLAIVYGAEFMVFGIKLFFFHYVIFPLRYRSEHFKNLSRKKIIQQRRING